MPGKNRRQDLNDPGVWLEFAQDDLKIAKKGKALGVRLSALCFHAQQAAEKSLKAVLLFLGTDFRPTHSIEELLDLIPKTTGYPPKLKKAEELTDYAVSGRYPAVEFIDTTPEKYRELVKSAEDIVKWAEKVLGKK